MKYYRLDNSVNTKEIGRHFLQATFADKKTLDSGCSLVRDEFPNFKPDLRFDLEKGSKLTDVINSCVEVPGFTINERVKTFLISASCLSIGITKQLLQTIREMFIPTIASIFCLMIIL